MSDAKTKDMQFTSNSLCKIEKWSHPTLGMMLELNGGYATEAEILKSVSDFFGKEVSFVEKKAPSRRTCDQLKAELRGIMASLELAAAEEKDPKAKADLSLPTLSSLLKVKEETVSKLLTKIKEELPGTGQVGQ